jgi:WASH complex subunit strumpellin
MVKLANVKKSHLTSIDIISDVTWIWIVLRDYIKPIQKEIRKDPDISLLLKNTFMKFSSILNTPMNRIFQARSPDLEPVSKFYS